MNSESDILHVEKQVPNKTVPILKGINYAKFTFCTFYTSQLLLKTAQSLKKDVFGNKLLLVVKWAISKTSRLLSHIPPALHCYNLIMYNFVQKM